MDAQHDAQHLEREWQRWRMLFDWRRFFPTEREAYIRFCEAELMDPKLMERLVRQGPVQEGHC